MTQSDYVSQEMIDELVAQYPDEIQGIAAENYLGGGQIKDEADSDNYANVSVDGICLLYTSHRTECNHPARCE